MCTTKMVDAKSGFAAKITKLAQGNSQLNRLPRGASTKATLSCPVLPIGEAHAAPPAIDIPPGSARFMASPFAVTKIEADDEHPAQPNIRLSIQPPAHARLARQN